MSDPVDHCAEAARLRQLQTTIASGEAVTRARFDNEEVEFAKADPARLDRLIAYHDRECLLASGHTPPRTRFAKRVGFKPY